MKQGNHDRALGPTDMGGLVFATVQCPIFDPRPDIGNFQWVDIEKNIERPEDRETFNNKRIQESRKPLKDLDPFEDGGYIRVLNVLALEYYELSEDYRASEQGFTGFNWLRLLQVAESVLESQPSIGAFINRLTVRVRLAAGAEMGWNKSAQDYVMQVTTPAFGQVIQDESIAYPIHPPAHTDTSRIDLVTRFTEIDGIAKAFDQRKINNERR